MLSPNDVPLTQQIACVQREIRLRDRVYPRLVLTRRLTADQAFEERVRMQAVLATLQRLRDRTPASQQSFL